MSEFIIPNDQPVAFLDCDKAFIALTEKEKLYAHYLSKASFYGGLISLAQVSVESPLIFTLLYKLYRMQSVLDLKQVAMNECGFTEEEFTAFVVYALGIFSSMGNYKSFGDLKFIPNLSKDKFEKLIVSSKAGKTDPKHIKELLTNCLQQVFSLKDNEKQLGFPYCGITTYFSKNITEEDAKIVKDFITEKNIGLYNTRLFKTVDETGGSCYEIRLASVLTTDDEEEKSLLSGHTVNGHKFAITRGDYSHLLKLVNKYILLAKDYAANENQVKMLEQYIHSFHTGSLASHKMGSRFWIKDKSPIVETYIGFIETYRDPSGMRGEFEGFVAMVNKSMSAKFAELVKAAEEVIPLLPWPSTYEKDKFLRPDFTSLDVLTFSGGCVPLGICIPNYDEIRQNEGFKNVSLGNIIPAAYKEKSVNFLNKEDQALVLTHAVGVCEVQVGLHELYGHGSGKLFMMEKDGTLNFDVDKVLHLETGEKVSRWYKEGETYDSIFDSMGSSYEECRAEAVGIYLCTIPEVLRIFGYEGQDAETIMYVNWLEMCYRGLRGLEMYQPKTNSWMQAHSQARYVILQVLLEAGQNFVKVEKIKGADGNPDLLLTLNRSLILTAGKEAIGNFLNRLQLYKSTADIDSAKSMYDKYSAVTSEENYPFLDYREIVMARKKPRMMFIEANTFIKDGKVELKNYESTHEGLIQSWIERFDDANTLDIILSDIWAKDKHYFM